MRNVSHKVTTRRSAIARAELTASPATLTAIRDGTVPKGDPLPVSKVAAVMAAKRTTDWIPYCHPIPIEFVDVKFELQSDRIIVTVEVVSVAKTGVEMEALTAASAAVLNLYDMLKMFDDDMEIVGIRLIEKRGGKSDFVSDSGWTAGVIVVSDRVSAGTFEDKSGGILKVGLESLGAASVAKTVVGDDHDQIQKAVQELVSAATNIVLVTGGTGISPRDRTPEAISPLFDLELPGISETLRRYGQDRIPTAHFSRSVAGIIGSTIVLAIPGSPAACEDALVALFPGLLHAQAMLRGEGHS